MVNAASVALLMMIPALALAGAGGGKTAIRENLGKTFPQTGGKTFFEYLYTSNGACPGTWTSPSGGATAVTRGAANVDCSGTLTSIGSNTVRVETAGILQESGTTEKFLNNTSPATQDISLTATYHYAWMEGTGSVTWAVKTATASAGLPCTATATSDCYFTISGAGTVTATVADSVTFASVMMNVKVRTSKIVTAGSNVARSAEVLTTTNHLLAAKPWCITADMSTPRNNWVHSGTRGLVMVGTTLAAANTLAVTTSSSAPQCVLYDSAAASRSQAHDAFSSGSGSHIISCCSHADHAVIYVDGAPSGNLPSGAGAGVISTMPASVTLGAFSTNINGNFASVRQCVGSNDPSKCGQSMKVRVGSIGDSETASGSPTWPALMGTSLGAGYVVFNRAVNGYIASQALAKWRTDEKSQSVGDRRLTILIGVNDLLASTSAVDTYASIATLISEAQADGLSKIVIGTVMPTSSLSGAQNVQLLILNGMIEASGATVVDTWSAFKDPGDSTILAAAYDSGDHLHINDAGRVLMASLFAAAIQ